MLVYCGHCGEMVALDRTAKVCVEEQQDSTIYCDFCTRVVGVLFYLPGNTTSLYVPVGDMVDLSVVAHGRVTDDTKNPVL